MRRAILWVAMVAAVGCGGEPGEDLRVEVATLEARPEWMAASDLPERTAAAAELAAAHWGGADLRGWTIRFVDGIERCDDAPAGVIMGCTRPKERIIDVRVDAATPCVLASALLHEIGHVAMPDEAGHSDPRWSDPGFWVGLLGDAEADGARDGPRCEAALALWREWWRQRAG